MILSNIKSYLNNNDYNINIFDNNIYVDNYKKLKNVSDNEILIEFDKFKLCIKGNLFTIVKIFDKEILFKGNIESIQFIYEKNN